MGAEVKQRGLTWRSILALLFSTGVVQLAIIYYQLITASSFPLQAWFVILLWSELSRFLGAPLTKQELFILLSFQYAIAGGYALRFLEPIMYMYYVTAPEVRALGIVEYIPSWWLPPLETIYKLYRSNLVYINPAWLAPISLMVISTALGMIANISMGFFAYSLYVKTEKLEFPAATAQADTIITLAEREPTQTRVLMLSALFGVLYNLLVSFIPFVFGPFLSTGGTAIYTVISPIAGDYDLSPVVASLFPGAGFAFTLNIINYLPGLLLPLNIAISQFIGAFVFYFLGTHLITKWNLWPSESPYSQSWTIALLVERSNLYFYTSIIIGLSLAATFMPFILRPKTIMSAFSGIRRGVASAEERMPMLMLALFIASCLGSVFLVYYLTGFPIWILTLFTLGGSLLASFLSVSSSGVTFTGFNVPYLRELMIYSSHWPSKEIWFAPVTLYTGGAGVAIAFKQADLLNADKNEYIKAYILVVALGFIMSFLQVSYLWWIAPIPSVAYPATITVWPVNALNWARFQRWIWYGYIFREELINYSFIAGAIVYTALQFLKKPFLLISFITGTQLGIPFTLAQLVGCIIAQKILTPIMDRKKPGMFRMLRGRMVMGVTIGWGFMEFIRALLILVGRSMWLLPY